MAQVVNEVQAISQIRSRLTMVLAIAVIAVMVTLLALAGAFATSTGEVENVIPNVGSAIIHDDAGSVHLSAAPNVNLSGKVAGVH